MLFISLDIHWVPQLTLNAPTIKMADSTMSPLQVTIQTPDTIRSTRSMEQTGKELHYVPELTIRISNLHYGEYERSLSVF